MDNFTGEIMKSVEVFNDPDLFDLSSKIAANLLGGLNGIPVPVGLSALFTLFVGIAEANGVDTGTEFETMLATYEGRKCATHRGPMTVN